MNSSYTLQKTCKNCDAEIIGAYCHTCGQKSTTGRITFKETFHQFLSATFSFEGPLLRTIKYLLINPGKVYREFLNGKRNSYYKPVSFFVLITAVYLIIRVLINFDPLASSDFSRSPENIRKATEFFVNNLNFILIFLAISIGFLLKLFFWKRYNMAEYICIGFYMSGLYILAGIFIMLITQYTYFHVQQYQLYLLGIIIYYGVFSFFNRVTIWLALKYLIISALSIILYIFLGICFSYMVVAF